MIFITPSNTYQTSPAPTVATAPPAAVSVARCLPTILRCMAFVCFMELRSCKGRTSLWSLIRDLSRCFLATNEATVTEAVAPVMRAYGLMITGFKVDGNKRTGLLTALEFLSRNGFVLRSSTAGLVKKEDTDELYNIAIQAAQSSISVEEIASFFKRKIKRH